MINPHVFQFLVTFKEDIINTFGSAMEWFRKYFRMKFVRIPGTDVYNRDQKK
jgi:hypothetical protein